MTSVPETCFNQPIPDGEDWNWLRQLSASYQKCINSYFATWLSKATATANVPPKAKHVRRIIISSLRDPSCTFIDICNTIIKSRPWKDNPIVAAKCLYIMLLVYQYQERPESAGPVKVQVEVIKQALERMHPDKPAEKAYQEIGAHLAAVLHSKILLHTTTAGLAGNVSIGIGRQITSPEQMLNEIRRHLTIVQYELNGFLRECPSAEPFPVTILASPIIEEASNCYKMLYTHNPDEETSAMLKQTDVLLNKAEAMPFLKTSVNYPSNDDPICPPKPRFPIKPA